MTEFRLPYGKERLMCESCLIVDTYDRDKPFVCNRCGHQNYQRSEHFDDEWIAHHKNTKALAEAQQLIAVLESEIEKFNQGWFGTWNSHKPEQLSFETPEIIDPADFFSGEM